MDDLTCITADLQVTPRTGTLILKNNLLRSKYMVSKEVIVHSGVPQGKVIGHLLLLVMVNGLSDHIHLFCWLFTDDTKTED